MEPTLRGTAASASRAAAGEGAAGAAGDGAAAAAGTPRQLAIPADDFGSLRESASGRLAC